MERPIPTYTAESMKQLMVQCRYWEEMYNICVRPDQTILRMELILVP